MAKIKNFEFSDVNISKSELIWYLYTNEFNKFRDEISISDGEAVEQVLENIKRKIKQGFTGRTNILTKEYLKEESEWWLYNSLKENFEQAESNHFRNNP
jgi:hypothetical protein